MHIKKYGEETVYHESILQTAQFYHDTPVWIKSKVVESRFEDESDLMNLGFPQEETLHNLEISLSLLPSAYIDYPKNYKFISIAIEVDPTIKVISRETYSLLDLFGDVGGLYEFIQIAAGMLVSSFAALKLKALIANKLYSWYVPKTRESESIPNYACLEVYHLIQNLILCCCQSRWFKEYSEALDKADDDLMNALDLISFSKRLRQHTAALNLTVAFQTRKIAALMAHHRPIEYIQEKDEKNDGSNLWYQHENFSMKEKIKISIYQRYLIAIEKDQAPEDEKEKSEKNESSEV